MRGFSPGSGERFWPGAAARPKHCCVSGSNKPLEELARPRRLIPTERVLILTKSRAESGGAIAPNSRRQHSAERPSVTLGGDCEGCRWVARRDHSDTICLPASIIKDHAALKERHDRGASGRGDRPCHNRISRPALPRFAQRAWRKVQARQGRDGIHRALRFRRKTNAELAESFLRKGNFAGSRMFVCSVRRFERFNRQSPDWRISFRKCAHREVREDVRRALGNKLPRISFDFAIRNGPIESGRGKQISMDMSGGTAVAIISTRRKTMRAMPDPATIHGQHRSEKKRGNIAFSACITYRRAQG